LSPRSACIITLGCPRNEVDSEAFAGVLRQAGWKRVSDPGRAGLLLLNTCAFIGPAVEESLEALDEAMESKRSGDGRILVLAGCLPGRFGDDGSGGLEEIDLIIGPGDSEGLAGFLGTDAASGVRARLGRRFDRYLKIADGCLNRCSFCVLPAIRGPFRPARRNTILADADSLAESGAREIGIVGQDLLAWKDGACGPADLVSELAARHPDIWFRLYYLHPGRFDGSVIEAMRNHRNIAPYIDLSVQHASDRILTRMNRGYGRSRLEDIAGMISHGGIETACRLTVIAGYPGETDSDFDELCSFLSGFPSLRSLVVFQYWHEEGSPEYARGDADLIDPSLAAERVCRLDSMAEEAAESWGERLAGRTTRVLAETTRRGRTWFDAPLVDGEAVFSDPVKPGKFYDVLVGECRGLSTQVSVPPGN